MKQRIASTLAAKIYNLEVLKHNIEDDKKNVTRFLFMGKKIEHPEYKKNEKFITSCIFKVKDKPALYINVWVVLPLMMFL